MEGQLASWIVSLITGGVGGNVTDLNIHSRHHGIVLMAVIGLIKNAMAKKQ